MKPILIIGKTNDVGDAVGARLRELGRVAVQVTGAETALHLLDDIEFGAVLVIVDTAADWTSCATIAAAASCPVAVVTNRLSPDRRYRERAFESGAAAYVCEPCTKGKLRAMLLRVAAGERGVELTDGAAYSG